MKSIILTVIVENHKNIFQNNWLKILLKNPGGKSIYHYVALCMIIKKEENVKRKNHICKFFTCLVISTHN